MPPSLVQRGVTNRTERRLDSAIGPLMIAARIDLEALQTVCCGRIDVC
jgi:hypothetical protein